MERQSENDAFRMLLPGQRLDAAQRLPELILVLPEDRLTGRGDQPRPVGDGHTDRSGTVIQPDHPHPVFPLILRVDVHNRV